MCPPSTPLAKKLQKFESEEKESIFHTTEVQRFRSTDMGILLKPYLNVQLQYLASLFSLPPFSPVSGHSLFSSAMPLVGRVCNLTSDKILIDYNKWKRFRWCCKGLLTLRNVCGKFD